MRTHSKHTFEFDRRRKPPHREDSDLIQRGLLGVVDLGLASVICIAPFIFGGRHDMGRFVFVSLVAVTAAAWFIRQATRTRAVWRPTFAHCILLLAIGLVGLQITPLPQTWLAELAPRNGGLLPLWQPHGGAGVQLGSWDTLSLAPHATTKALALLLGYVLLFVVVVQRVRETADVRRLLCLIGASAVIMAGFGLLQYFTSNGCFFWFFDHPYRSTDWYVSGSFINRNHFANFLVLGIGPLVAWLVASVRQHSSMAPKHPSVVRQVEGMAALASALVVAFVAFAVLLSLSRGGTLALFVSVLVLGSVYAHGRLVDSKYLYGAIGLTVVVLGLLSLYGYDQVARRLNSLAQGSVDSVDQEEGRRNIWTANVEAFRAGWIPGAGVGSHRMIYPVYLPESSPKEYTHAENGYLQIASETGVGGVALLLAGLGLCGSWCVTCFRYARSELELVCFGACAAGLAASAAHSLVDFVWYIPACMSITVVLAGCTLRLAQLSRETETRQSGEVLLGHPQRLAAAAMIVAASVWMISTWLGPAVASIHWDRYLRASMASSRVSDQTLLNLVASKKTDSADTEKVISRTMLEELQQVVAWEPDFARARLRLAAHLSNEFNRRQRNSVNPMDVTQVRDAALASKFASSEELKAWLHRAFGDDCELLYSALAHAHAGVALCPLQGEGYLTLANLCFLEGGGRSTVAAYVDQGLRVRPHDGDVLFEAGRQKLLAGDMAGALALWTQCYRDVGPHQLRIVSLLAGRIPATMFLQTFQPDWHTLMPIWNRYRQLGQEQDLLALVSYAYQSAEQQTQNQHDVWAARIWQRLAKMFTDIGRNDKALTCLERAYAIDPRLYEVRLALGQALLEAGHYTKAEPHLRWCLSRHPENKYLSDALVQVAKGRLAEQDQREDSSVQAASFQSL